MQNDGYSKRTDLKITLIKIVMLNIKRYFQFIY